MRRPTARLVLLLTTYSVVSATPAASQPVNRIAAKIVFQEAKRLFQAGHYRAAIRAFQRAYGYRQHRVIQYNIALSYARLGDTVPSARHLRRYLATASRGDPPLPYELRRVLRRTGVVIVATASPRSAIYVDDRFVGMGRAEVVVRPGRHRLRVRVGHRWRAERHVLVGGGREVRWRVGRGTGVRPRRDGSWRARHARLHWGWFAGGVATTLVTFLTAAGVTSRADELAAQATVQPEDPSLARDRRRHALAARVLWGVTAALAALTATAGVFTDWPRRHRRSRTRVTPLVGPGGVGLAVAF